MLHAVLGVIGLFVGLIGYHDFGAVFGLVLGLMLAEILSLRKRLGKLEKGLGTGQQEQAPEPADQHVWKKAAQPSPPTPQPKSVTLVARKDAPAVSPENDLSDLEADLISAQTTSDTTAANAAHIPGGAQKSKESFVGLPSQLARYLKDFFRMRTPCPRTWDWSIKWAILTMLWSARPPWTGGLKCCSRSRKSPVSATSNSKTTALIL